MGLGRVSSLFLFDILFLKMLSSFAPPPQKKLNFGQKSDLLCFFDQYFQKWEVDKRDKMASSQYMHLDGFGGLLKVFVEKCFLPLFRYFWVKELIFGNFSGMQFLAGNLTIWMDSLWSLLSGNVYFYILYLIGFRVVTGTFSQDAAGLRGWYQP